MKSYDTRRYDQAAELLPFTLRIGAEGMPVQVKAAAEEIRLRAGRKPTLLLPEGELEFPGLEPLLQGALNAVLAIATRASVHSTMDSIREGYITTRGGFRVGLCGSAAVQKGEITGFRALSSVSIRISRQIIGLSSEIMEEITQDGKLKSTLLLSPPGAGKTTLLRDIVRAASEGEGCARLRISLADERGEVAAMSGGVPRLDVGRQTDVLEGVSKAKAAMLLLRTMNPQVLAMDEISAPEDIEALKLAANCGVILLASAHGESAEDLEARPLYRSLKGIFQRLILIRREKERRDYEVRIC